MEKIQFLDDTEFQALSHLQKELQKSLPLHSFKMVLFGSKVRGDADEQSDIDIAIIIEGMDRSMKNVILDLVTDVKIEYLLPISAMVISSEEFEHLRMRERRIAIDIDQEGILI